VGILSSGNFLLPTFTNTGSRNEERGSRKKGIGKRKKEPESGKGIKGDRLATEGQHELRGTRNWKRRTGQGTRFKIREDKNNG